jgi:HEAT repeat protein
VSELSPKRLSEYFPKRVSDFAEIRSHPSLAILINAVDHERGAGRQVAVRFLGDVGPGAKAAAPMLLAEVREGVYSNDGLDALRKIDPANQNAVALLLRRVRDSDAVVRLNAASWLARWEPPHEAGISALAELARSHPDEGTRIEAMYYLARVGTRGKSAVPALGIAARDPDPNISSAAACTLRTIRGGVSSNPE